MSKLATNQGISYQQSLVLLHVTIIIWGFTGILGKIISIPSDQLVWYRMLIGSATIGLYAWYTGNLKRPASGQLLQLLGVGCIIALHWITFFGSIKASNVSIALACLSSGSLFTAILEPIFFRRKILAYEIVFGLAVIGALVLIFKFETQFQLGIILSVISAFLASLFTTINGKFAQTQNPVNVSFYEIAGGWMVLSLWMLANHSFAPSMFHLSLTDILSLITLGTICTGFAFLAGVTVMKKLSPFTVSLSLNLEPIYAIVLAFVFFNEYKYLTPEFYIGAFVILATVVANAVVKASKTRRNNALAIKTAGNEF